MGLILNKKKFKLITTAAITLRTDNEDTEMWITFAFLDWLSTVKKSAVNKHVAN